MKKTLTTSTGMPIDDNQNSRTAGEYGPITISDWPLIDKLAAFDRERIPERVVHAKGAGAHGYFEVTKDMSKYCKAAFLNRVGKRTPLFLRFSTVAGERGAPDTDRDPRGFAIKFYTEEGNFDMVGNNTPVFFIRDPMKFPDFIHSQKKMPQTNTRDTTAMWDFWTLVPECIHQVTILFSDRGTPDGHRHMNGYSSHTYKWINAANEVFYVKLHFKTMQGIKNFTAEEAAAMAMKDPDYSTRDLFNNIAKGNFPSWRACVQIMPEKDAANYKWNIFDVTKVWPQSDYPLIEYGRFTLNRNPENYFAEVEQSAFAPTHTVPGIEPSEDKMLQGRLFSYPDTHRHRLGANYTQIPINCPYRARADHYQRDGPMNVNGNFGSKVNYEPNSMGGPVEERKHEWKASPVYGAARRYSQRHPNCDYAQARTLYERVMTETDREHLVKNLVGHMTGVRKDVLERAILLLTKVHPDYGARVAKGLGMPPIKAKL